MASKWLYARARTFNRRYPNNKFTRRGLLLSTWRPNDYMQEHLLLIQGAQITGLLEGASSYQHGVQINICQSIYFLSKGPNASFTRRGLLLSTWRLYGYMQEHSTLIQGAIKILIYRSIFFTVGPKRIHRRVSAFDQYWRGIADLH